MTYRAVGVLITCIVGCRGIGKPEPGPPVQPPVECSGKLEQVTQGGKTTNAVRCPNVGCPDGATCTFVALFGQCVCLEKWFPQPGKAPVIVGRFTEGCHLEVSEPQGPISPSGIPESWGKVSCVGFCDDGRTCKKSGESIEFDDGRVVSSTKCVCE